jgi:hypothetical protein
MVIFTQDLGFFGKSRLFACFLANQELFLNIYVEQCLVKLADVGKDRG